jgi:imidazolonepropionase
VEACKKASFDDLFRLNERYLKKFMASGITTLEMKSGYGLDLETELKLL